MCLTDYQIFKGFPTKSSPGRTLNKSNIHWFTFVIFIIITTGASAVITSWAVKTFVLGKHKFN